MDRVNILGTAYTIKRNCNPEKYPKLKDLWGFTDYSTKEIVISKIDKCDESIEDIRVFINKVVRHEVIHAFLYESGLDENSEFAKNEELIDWIALQYMKMFEVFDELGVI